MTGFRVAVTGGAGFIGANLSRELLATSGIDEVVVIDTLSTGCIQNLVGTPLRFIEGDSDAVVRGVSSSSAVNLAFGGRFSLLDVVAALERILSHPLAFEFADPRPGDVKDSQADQAELRSLFPSIEPVAFETRSRRTVDWFQEAIEHKQSDSLPV